MEQWKRFNTVTFYLFCLFCKKIVLWTIVVFINKNIAKSAELSSLIL